MIVKEPDRFDVVVTPGGDRGLFIHRGNNSVFYYSIMLEAIIKTRCVIPDKPFEKNKIVITKAKNKLDKLLDSYTARAEKIRVAEYKANEKRKNKKITKGDYLMDAYFIGNFGKSIHDI